jgi:hypothetical protein
MRMGIGLGLTNFRSGGGGGQPVTITKDCAGNVTFTGGYYRPTVTITKDGTGNATFTIGA